MIRNDAQKAALYAERAIRGSYDLLLTVPGNLLLAGEYAVLEPGGVGVSLAVERRAELWLHRLSETPPGQASFSVYMIGPESRERVRCGPGEPMPAVLDAAGKELAGYDLSGNWDIVLDTSAFYSATGRKLGLGSSAAAVLLLTAALTHIAIPGSRISDLAARRRLWTDLGRRAVNAHRHFQGGKGSGYDVLCSLTGGIACFTGGQNPSIVSLPRLKKKIPRFIIFEGPRRVGTKSAIEAYTAFKQSEPHTVAAYLGASRIRADSLRKSRSWQGVNVVLEDARQAGIAFGRAIGVPADLALPAYALPVKTLPTDGSDADGNNAFILPEDIQVLFHKAAGAGNETGIAFVGSESVKKQGSRTQQYKSRTMHPDGTPIFLDRASTDGLHAHKAVFGEARGKLLLFGEHAAVYGHVAIGVSVPETCVIRFAESKHCSRRFPYLNGDEEHQAEALLNIAIKTAGKPTLPQGYFSYMSDVPETGGFGSSAAVSVALSRIVAHYTGRGNIDDLWSLSNTLDCFFHGFASGIDTGLSLRQGLWAFSPLSAIQMRTPGQPIVTAEALGTPIPEMWVVYGSVPRLGTAKEKITEVRERMQSGDRETTRCIAALGEVAQKAKSLLKSSVGTMISQEQQLIDHLGALSGAANGYLGDLGLGHPEIDSILDIALQEGSPGGKISGAGGGGAWYVWAYDSAHAAAIQTAVVRELSRRNTVPQSPVRKLKLTEGKE